MLVDGISMVLNDPTDSSKDHPDLQLLLETLRRTLYLTKRAVKAYKDKPLGQNLVNVVTPEVGQCCMLLWELRDKIYGTWLLLICTRIGHLWRQVFRGSWDGNELASLKSRLRRSGDSLGILLMALGSYVLFTVQASPNTSAESLEGLHGWISETNGEQVTSKTFMTCYSHICPPCIMSQ